jgi:hypothetical protein
VINHCHMTRAAPLIYNLINHFRIDVQTTHDLYVLGKHPFQIFIRKVIRDWLNPPLIYSVHMYQNFLDSVFLNIWFSLLFHISVTTNTIEVTLILIVLSHLYYIYG